MNERKKNQTQKEAEIDRCTSYAYSKLRSEHMERTAIELVTYPRESNIQEIPNAPALITTEPQKEGWANDARAPESNRKNKGYIDSL